MSRVPAAWGCVVYYWDICADFFLYVLILFLYCRIVNSLSPYLLVAFSLDLGSNNKLYLLFKVDC